MTEANPENRPTSMSEAIGRFHASKALWRQDFEDDPGKEKEISDAFYDAEDAAFSLPASSPEALRMKITTMFAELGEEICSRSDKAELRWFAQLVADVVSMTVRLEAGEQA